MRMTWFLAFLLCTAVGGLLAIWMNNDGSLNVPRWRAPSAGSGQHALASLVLDDRLPIGSTLVILERPLFSPERRPAMPASADTPSVAPPDTLDNLLISGVFVTADGGGIVARSDGKVRRFRVGDSVGDWKLASVEGKEARFERSGESRKIGVKRAPMVSLAGDNAGSVSPVEGGSTAGGGVQSSDDARRAMADEARDRLRRRNEVRAKAGLPPVTD